MTYQLSQIVERKYIIASSFTDDEPLTSTEGRETKDAPTFTEGELSTCTEGRETKYAPTFNEGELPNFTEGSKKRCTNFY